MQEVDDEDSAEEEKDQVGEIATGTNENIHHDAAEVAHHPTGSSMPSVPGLLPTSEFSSFKGLHGTNAVKPSVFAGGSAGLSKL